MKKVLAIVAAAAALISMSSCDNRPNPAGEWSGRISEKVPGDQWTMDLTLNFTKDGSVKAVYEITSVEDLQGNDSIMSPFQARITASVSESGTWQYVDGENDEILLTFDHNSLDVEISPDKIEYLVDQLTGEEQARVQPLSPGVIENFKNKYRYDFSQNNSSVILDDVRVRDNVFKFEVDDTDVVLTGTRAK